MLTRLRLALAAGDCEPDALLRAGAKDLEWLFIWYRNRADLGSSARAKKQFDRLNAIRSMESGASGLEELQAPERADLASVFLTRLARRLDLDDLEELHCYSIDGSLTQALIEELWRAAADVLAKGHVENEPWHVARVEEPSWPKTEGWSAMDNLIADLGEWYLKYTGRRPAVTVDHHHGGAAVQPKKGGKFVEFVQACCIAGKVKEPSAATIELALSKARDADGAWRARRKRGWNLG